MSRTLKQSEFHVVGNFNADDAVRLAEHGVTHFHYLQPGATEVMDEVESVRQRLPNIVVNHTGNVFTRGRDENALDAKTLCWMSAFYDESIEIPPDIIDAFDYIVGFHDLEESEFYVSPHELPANVIVYLMSDSEQGVKDLGNENPHWGYLTVSDVLRLISMDDTVGGPWTVSDLQWLRDLGSFPTSIACCVESKTHANKSAVPIWGGGFAAQTVETIASLADEFWR